MKKFLFVLLCLSSVAYGQITTRSLVGKDTAKLRRDINIAMNRTLSDVLTAGNWVGGSTPRINLGGTSSANANALLGGNPTGEGFAQVSDNSGTRWAYGQLLPGRLVFQKSPTGIVYNGQTVYQQQNSNTNRLDTLPDATGVLAVSVNGKKANKLGDITVDSSNLPALHSENYYNTKYKSITSTSRLQEITDEGATTTNSLRVVGGGKVIIVQGNDSYVGATDPDSLVFSRVGVTVTGQPYLLLQGKDYTATVKADSLTRNVKLQIPTGIDSGFVAVSVNGIAADHSGNVNISTPVYTGISLISDDYTIPGPGIYRIDSNDNTHYVRFPNPAELKGPITLILKAGGDGLRLSAYIDTEIFKGIDTTASIDTQEANTVVTYVSDGENIYIAN